MVCWRAWVTSCIKWWSGMLSSATTLGGAPRPWKLEVRGYLAMQSGGLEDTVGVKHELNGDT